METQHEIRILLIDENPKVRWSITAALASLGILSKVTVVDRVCSVNDLFMGEAEFDLAIVDPFALLGHGVELFASMHAHPIGKHLPVLIYTASHKEKWNGSHLLTKPAHNDDLAIAILQTIPQSKVSELPVSAVRALTTASA